MKRVILATMGTVVGLIMLLSFKTRPATTAASPPTTIAGADAGGGPANPAGSTGAPTTSASSGSTGTKTVTGDEAETRYGPVQVKVTLRNGVVTAVEATEWPEDRPRDQQINSYAIPQLNQEATQAKNANIDMISGATFTSQGYITSLQSALDRASR